MAAYHGLHHHIKEKLTEVSHMLILGREEMNTMHLNTGLITSIDTDKLIIGAIERAFLLMDDEIRQQRFDFRIEGGCTALVSLFMKGELFHSCSQMGKPLMCHSFSKFVKKTRDENRT